MPNWKGSNRRAELPKDWDKIRRKVFSLDGYQCTFVAFDGVRCTAAPTDCDHVGDKWNHGYANLTSLCDFHHKKKTGAQGAAAAHANRRRIEARFSRTEDHPGLI